MSAKRADQTLKLYVGSINEIFYWKIYWRFNIMQEVKIQFEVWKIWDCGSRGFVISWIEDG